MLEHIGEHRGLVRDDADAVAAEMREADDDVRREILLHFHKLAVVDHAAEHVVHVVRFVRTVRDDIEQRLISTINWIASCAARRSVDIVRQL